MCEGGGHSCWILWYHCNIVYSIVLTNRGTKFFVHLLQLFERYSRGLWYKPEESLTKAFITI